MSKVIDVAIIGGGPAGLNAALVLGRARRKVAVIDDGKARNRITHATHGFLTRDGVTPAEFRIVAKEQIAAYPSVQFIEDTASSITGADGMFEVVTAAGTVIHSKKILFAVGKKDKPLGIKGLQDVYGKSAFVCPFCDGWELRDQTLVLISDGAKAMHMAKLLLGWTSRVTLCTNGPDGLTDEERHDLERHGIPVLDSPIEAIESNEGIVDHILLKDGRLIPCRGIFFAPTLVAGSELPETLGCEMTETESVVVNEQARTTVPGVFSAGDAASDMYQAIAAAAQGSMAGAMIHSELCGEEWNGVSSR